MLDASAPGGGSTTDQDRGERILPRVVRLERGFQDNRGLDAILVSLDCGEDRIDIPLWRRARRRRTGRYASWRVPQL